MRFHITYKQHKKLVEVEHSKLKTVDDYLVTFARVFKTAWTSEVLLQCYIQEIEDWIDVDDSVIEAWGLNNGNEIVKIKVKHYFYIK